MGRPSDYTPELAAEICGLLAEGKSLRSICREEQFPALSTVMRWLGEKDKADFQEQYARARDAGMDAWAEEILEISDDGSADTIIDGEGKAKTNHENVQRSRLRVDTRKWIMARMAPKKYGDRVVTELHGKDGGPIQTEELSTVDVARRVAFVLAQGTAQKT